MTDLNKCSSYMSVLLDRITKGDSSCRKTLWHISKFTNKQTDMQTSQ